LKWEKEWELLVKRMEELQLVEPYQSECEKRFELEQMISMTVNAARKKVQRELDTLKNKQLGPKWNKAWADYHMLKQLRIHRIELEEELQSIQQYQNYLEPSIQFLYEMGFITCSCSMELTHDSLTLKGILATEVNEGHALLMTELYVQETLHHLTGNELVAVLASFQEKKETEDSPSIQELHVSSVVQDAIVSLNKMSSEYQRKEDKYGMRTEGYWMLSTQLVEPMLRWMEGEHASVICAEYGIFEGNFIRSVMKMANMMDEWLSMATYCQHVEQVEKIIDVRTRMIRDIVISDSLYLRL